MKFTRKKAWGLVFVYVTLVYASFYFTPSLNDFLIARESLGAFINIIYTIAFLSLLWIFYFGLKVRDISAWGFLAFVLILFFGALSRTELTTDRLHFLEHSLGFVLIYLAMRFSFSGMILIGRTFVLSVLFSLLDEWTQSFFPGREVSSKDFWTNVFSYYLAAGIVAIAVKYRNYHDRAAR